MGVTSTTASSRNMVTVSLSRPGCHRSIGEALGVAVPGDVITVEPGTYAETLEIRASVTISAAGPAGAVQVTSDDGQPLLVVRSESVVLSGLTLTHTGAEIAAIEVSGGNLRLDGCTLNAESAAVLWARGAATVKVTDCHFGNPVGAGVVATDTVAGAITDSVFDGIGTAAVVLRSSGEIEIARCEMTRVGGNAMLASAGANGVVEDCRVTGAEDSAIVLEDSASTTLRRVHVSNSASVGILLASDAAPLVDACTVVGVLGQGMVVMGRAHPDVVGLTVEESGASGLHLVEEAGGRFRKCSVVACTGEAVRVEGNARPYFTDLTVARSLSGLVVVDSAAVEVEEVTADDLTDAGLQLDSSGESDIRSVVIRRSREALRVGGQGMVRVESLSALDTAEGGIVVSDGANLECRNAEVIGCPTAVSVAAATLRLTKTRLADGSGAALHIADDSDVSLTEVTVEKFAVGIDWQGGRGKAERCHVSKCSSDAIVVATREPIDVVDCRVVDNAGAGLRTVGDGRNVVVTKLDSRGNAADDDVGPGEELDGEGYEPARRSPAEPKAANDADRAPRTGNADDKPESRLGVHLAELGSLVGLAEVKREVETLVRLHQMAERRAKAGLPAPPLSQHIIFSGSPGTGKTTVARIYAQILAELGVLRTGQLIETSRADLVASVVGGTALKTAEKFEAALGGVLFIDEAYTLAAPTGGGGPDFGREAIDTLVKLMEDHREDVALVVAGYTHEMRSFLASNPGLASRFGRSIEFADYSAEDLVEIVDGMCQAHDYRMEFETRSALLSYFEKMPRDAAFGNGRSARKVFEEMLGRQAYRLAEADDITTVTMTRLLPADIPALPGSAIGAAAGAVDTARVDELQQELQRMVGLTDVKREVSNVVDLLASARQREAAGLPAPSIGRHLIFAGPPGTGKTTIARLYGKILAALGVLARGQVVEVGRSDLVASYVGQTAGRTTEAFDRARGGILFIDEAYTLSSQSGLNVDFGREAIDTLVKLMEDHRDEVVVIAAGYQHAMSQFLDANQGLASRFGQTITFANYSTDELVTIVNQHAVTGGYDCDGPTLSALRSHFEGIERGPSFGNGRYARQVLEEAMTNHARRMRDTSDPTLTDLTRITASDVPSIGQVGTNQSVSAPSV